MGRVQLKYLRVRNGRAYWEPSPEMRALGFRIVALGVNGPVAWAECERLNQIWKDFRAGKSDRKVWPVGSLGWLFDQYRETHTWSEKKPRTREEYESAWTTIEPVFGDIQVSDLDFRACDEFYAGLKRTTSLHRRHRVFKILRSLLEVAIAFRLISENPTHRIANEAPRGRSAVWKETEVAALRARAWQKGYHGLAVVIAVSYDTGMAPVDVRLLTPAMLRRDDHGTYFETAREKSGKKVFATLSPETEELLEQYIAGLGFTVPPDQAFIRNRSAHAYSKDTLGDDFRTIRNVLYPGDDRKLMDMRRTSNVEAVVGGAAPTHLSAKLSNTLARSNQMFDTYSPAQLASVRQADQARVVGRKKLRSEQQGNMVGFKRVREQK